MFRIYQYDFVKMSPDAIFASTGTTLSRQIGIVFLLAEQVPRGALQLTTPITTITIDRVEAIKASGSLTAGAGDVDRGCPASLVSPVYGTPLHVLVEDAELR